jgi:hypothetical protein
MSDKPKTMRELFEEGRARAATMTPEERKTRMGFGFVDLPPVRFRDYEPRDDAALEEGSNDIVAVLNGAAHALSGGSTLCTSLRHVRNVRDGIQLVGGSLLGFLSPTLGKILEGHTASLAAEMGARLGAEAADPSLRCERALARIALDTCVAAPSSRSPQTFGMITPS